ncbi:unnamed protein product [Penicillium salamii]|uniref:Uncharacterized protein n=1 Tax=Penicillium salamii TaxID=1612424 RepID=A0A9W4NAJ6_9EURO|nr:unnamed protein product [Penicillium salamii]CAG8012294.1 unnamed protein product [Penicillium salamii]CAG8069820.1 unnamed protein product [Penicillium salamii]CAG8253754.1 unnamed protein product [Penicillium salamii]CAG8312289.1 unnamed protein product [Penicillium salamii]
MEPEVQEKKRPSQGWLPATLRWPYLLCLASLLLFLLAVVETLRQYSQRKGFLIHWSYAEDLPGATWQVYTYLPLVLALLAIVLLDICAQDVFRLEIYFQLAKQDATPARVLFANYCSNGVTASMIAARNRHWIVLCVAPVFLICRMFLPTLASGIISLDGTIFDESKTVHTWPSIVELDTQMSWFNSSLSHQGMLGRSDLGSMFLSRPSAYAAAPVSIPGDATENSFLTVNQTAYWSNLTCVTQSSSGAINNTFSSINSTSGTGSNQLVWLWQMRDFELSGSTNETNTTRCRINLDLEITSKSNQRSLHARYWAPLSNATDTNSSFVPVDGCDSFELFGVILDSRIIDGNITEPNITVLGCSPVYHQTQAAVTLNNNGSIADLQTDPDNIKPLNATDFYVQGLHDVISAKYTRQAQGIAVSNSSSQTERKLNIVQNSKPVNSTAFFNEMQFSWNENFITIINKLFNPASPPTTIDATLSSYVVILAVAPNTAIFTEAILIVCLIVLGMLASTCHRRRNFLQWDPGSIAAQCALISRLFSPSTKLLFSHTNFRQATTRQLRQWSKGKWVEWVDVSGEPRLCIVDRNQPPSHQLSPPVIKKGRRDPPPHFLVFPWFLAECVLLMGVLAAFGICLSYLRLKNIEDYATTAAALSILFLNYAPTAIASIIGSLITSVYRNLSAMEPYIRLQEGMATAKDSIIANRGFRTPYMALTRTRRRKPALLFGISVVCLADLVLRVLSGGVFEPQVQIYRTSSSSVARQYYPSLFESQANETGVGESIMAASRLMNNVSFLPWVSPEYFFVPFSVKHPYPDTLYSTDDATDDDDEDEDEDDEEYDDADADDDDAWATFSTMSRGIGADLDCRTIHPEFKSDPTQGWKYRFSGGTGVSNCTVEIRPETLKNSPGANFTDRSIQFIAPNGTDTCQTSNLFIFASWNQNTVLKSGSTGWMALQCKPKILVQDFNLEFDSRGMIQSYKPIPTGSITKGQLYQNASDSLGLFNQRLTSFSHSLPSRDPSSTQRHDWSGLLTSSTYDVLYPNSTEITSDHLTYVARTVYRRVFSAHLALWRDRYLEHVPSKQAVPVPATAIESLWGLTPSKVLIVAIICLVCVDTSALVAVFILRFNRFKGLRTPRSIGSLMPFVVGGSFATDCGDMYDLTEDERHALLLSQDRRYRLGEFAGETGDQWGLDYDDRHHPSEIELDELRSAM